MTMSATRTQTFLRSFRRVVRSLAGVTLMAVALAGCQVSEFAYDAPEFAPLPASLETKMTRLGMDKRSPIMLRIYKEENTLEVWKEARTGRYDLLQTYEICAWSGKVGPKKKEGDRQAPEGFYTVTPAQMNPKSSYYLSFNLGFPNAYDRSLGRTGSHLMVHGDCSSRGCYAMEDKQIQEIYALAREAFRGGQQAFQVQAFPFKMTPENMARYADDENLAFWEMLKEGADHFEVTGKVPKVSVCGQRYVFNATSSSGFSASAACPAYDVPDDVEQLVAAKSKSDLEKQRKEVARIIAQQDREKRWAEREAQLATFFKQPKNDEAGSAAPATATADAVPATATAPSGTAPVPRRSPAGKSGVAVAANSGKGDGGGFRMPNPFARFTSPDQPVASIAGVDAETPAPATTVAPATVTATVAAPATTPAPAAPATAPAAPQVAARQAAEQQTTVTAPLAYQPAEEQSGGFLSSMAKTSRGLFKRAGSMFSNGDAQ